MTVEEGHPVAEQLIGKGLITRTGGVLALTGAGERTAERLFATEREWLESLLAGWSPEQHAELEQVLTRLSRALLGDEADRYLVDRQFFSSERLRGDSACYARHPCRPVTTSRVTGPATGAVDPCPTLSGAVAHSPNK